MAENALPFLEPSTPNLAIADVSRSFGNWVWDFPEATNTYNIQYLPEYIMRHGSEPSLNTEFLK